MAVARRRFLRTMHSRRKPRRVFEPLEQRLLLATFIVNLTSDEADFDPADQLCDVDPVVAGEQCTLRAAIQQSNASVAVADEIQFNIGAGGPQTIAPGAALDPVTDPVVINGTTQPGFNMTPIIELDGSNAPGANGLTIVAGASTVQGLVINRFQGTGAAGIVLQAKGANLIVGNFLGTDVAGVAALPNTRGIVTVFSNGNTIGGTTLGSGNLIAGNTNEGVLIQDSVSNSVLGNLMGVKSNGVEPLGNGMGVFLFNPTINVLSRNTIGGLTQNAANIISGNTGDGIRIQTRGNLVVGNFIGTDATNTIALGNAGTGVFINVGSTNTIGGAAAGSANVIANSGGDGVRVNGGGSGNLIGTNSIFANAGLGINLIAATDPANGVTRNDLGDGDPGASNLQNFPVITTIDFAGGMTSITGTLNSAASTAFRIELFVNGVADPSGFGEGEGFLGATDVMTDGNGNAGFNFMFPAVIGGFFTTTATESATGNTSEFSCAAPEAPSFIVNTIDDVVAFDCQTSLREAIVLANNTPGMNTITFNIPGAGVRTIQVQSPLPVITDPVDINGYSQPGAAAGTQNGPFDAILLVELDGTNAGMANGLELNTTNSTIRGLVINRSGGSGIVIQGAGGNSVSGNFIGVNPLGTTPMPNGLHGILIADSPGNVVGGPNGGDGNLISGNLGDGIRLLGTMSGMNTIGGNFIGLNAAGGARVSNAMNGINLSDAANNVIGGGGAATRNVIAGNAENNILIGFNAAGNTVSGNFIGTDVSGMMTDPDGTPGTGDELGAGMHGIRIEGAPNNVIGGTGALEFNVIGGSQLSGINLAGVGSTNNLVRHNFIGVSFDGTTALGNSGAGVFVQGATDNVIGGAAANEPNVIRSNGGDGILIVDGNNNRITRNVIVNNGGLGIDLAPDGPNFPQDADPGVGANNLQNFPVLTSVTRSNSTTSVRGTLTSAPGTMFTIEFFASVPTEADPSTFGEGRLFIGSIDVMTDAVTGVAMIDQTFPVSVLAGDVVTATATDPAGNTSEFSQGFAATVPTLQFSQAMYSVSESVAGGTITITVTRTNGDAGMVDVSFATADGTAKDTFDYNAVMGKLDFPSGVTVRTFDVTILPDMLDEDDETVNLALSIAGFGAALGMPSTAVLTITDDDPLPSLSIDSVMANEANAGVMDMVFTVTLSVASGRDVSVQFLTADGTATAPDDYTAQPLTTRTIPAGSLTATIAVPFANDRRVEAAEMFTVTLSNPTNATLAPGQETGTGTIVDNDSATVAIAAGTTAVLEFGDTVNLPVTLTLVTNGVGPAELAVAVEANIAGNADYGAATATFAPGAADGAVANIGVTAVDDRLVEMVTESFPGQTLAVTATGGANVTVGAASGARQIDVTDNDSATVAIAAGTTTVAEGALAVNLPVTLTLATVGAGPAELAVTVQANLAGNADYGATAATFNPGATSGTMANIAVAAVDDRLVEPATESFTGQTLSVTSTGGASVTVDPASGARQIDVTDNDSATVAIAAGTTAVVEGALAVNLPVTLTLATIGAGPAELAVTVQANLAGNADYGATAATFNPGATSGTMANIAVAAVDDRLVEVVTESFPGQTLSVTSTGGANVTVDAASGARQIDVTDNDSATVAIPAGTTAVTEGALAVNLPVTLTLATLGAGPAELAVTVQANLAGNADYAAIAATFNPGATSGTAANIAVSAVDDRLVEAVTESFPGQTLAVTATGGASVMVDVASGARQIDVTDNDSASVATAAGTTTVAEGAVAVNLPVTLTLATIGAGPAELAVTVQANLAGNADYGATAATFNPGATSGTMANIAVAAVDDRLVEPATESFPGQTLSVTSTGGASVTVDPASGAQQIDVTDNDSATVAIAAGTTAAAEGALAVNLPVTLSLATVGAGPAELAVTVQANLTGNADYAATAATFNPGATSGAMANIAVAAVDDRLVEVVMESFPGQTLSVTSTGGANVTVDAVSGARQIDVTDNDSATVAIVSGTTAVTEGALAVNLPVTLTLATIGAGPAELAVTVQANLAGNADSAATAATFNPSATSGTAANIAVSAVNDRLVEAVTESFPGQTLAVTATGGANVTVGAGSGARQLDVTDNDSANVAIAAGTTIVAEGGAAVNLPVTLTLATSGIGVAQLAVAVQANLPGNADYTAMAATFNAGAMDGAMADIAVAAVDDMFVEGTETFPGQALSATSAAMVTAAGSRTIQVTDNDIDLRVTKTESIDPVVPGSGVGNLTYVVTIRNTGLTDATGVVVSEDLTVPPGVTVDSVMPSQGNFTNTVAPDGNWTVGGLPVGASATLTVVLTVSGAAASGVNVICDTATITAAIENRVNLADDSATECTSVGGNDFGDAPDPLAVTPGQYPTLLANNGARHIVGSGLFLGTRVDVDADGQPNATATGDDANGLDDEDGVVLPAALVARLTATVTVSVTTPNPGATARLDAWIDFNRNGIWDADEQIAANLSVTAGDNDITFLVPETAVAGITFARFRISSVGGLKPDGAAPDGEVEDYAVTITVLPECSAGVIADPANPGEQALVVLDCPGANRILFKSVNRGAAVNVSINKRKFGPFDATVIDRIVAFGLAANDVISVDPKLAIDALLDGGAGDDVVQGGGGNDTVIGGAGNDTCCGNGGDDTLEGDAGNDSMVGGDGDDEMRGGAGDDLMLGCDGSDMLSGDDGADFVNGGVGFDMVDGGTGFDLIADDLLDLIMLGPDGGRTFRARK